MKTLLDDLVVNHTMGGMLEFVKTGIYPDKLRISSTKYGKIWRIKLGEKNYKGSLRVNRKVVYNYDLGDHGFNVQEIKDDMPISGWIKIDMIERLVD